MEGDAAMNSLKEALKEIEDSLDDTSLSSNMYKLFNSLNDCPELENLSEVLRDQMSSLSDRHKRYMCVLALKSCSLPIFRLFFTNEIAGVTEENLSEANDLICELMCQGVNLYYKDFISAAIYIGFPDGIKFMCDQGVKFDPEVVDDWCFMKDGEDGKKGVPNVSGPGTNKNKHLEELARYFTSSGDIDMLGRILGRNEVERTRARKYIKNVEPALISAIHVENCDDISEDQAIKCLEMFISAGADVNKPASRIVNGFETSPTPLMMTALKGKTQIFEYLIQNGADVNRRDRMGENVLHYLINTEKDMTGCIDRIFSAGYRYGINVDKMIRITYTPLHLAVVKNKIPVARKLLDQGADIHSLDRKGKNLIHNLAEIDVNDDSLEFAKFLIDSGLDKELLDVEQHTPLSTAIKHKNTKLVKFLLTEKCEINTLCSYNTSSPLLMACEVYLSGQEDILLLLLESGCDVNFPNDRGVVALMKAAEYPSRELASLLLKYGADVNKQDQQGMYATSYCFKKRGYLNENSCTVSEMFRCLLDTGFDVRTHNKDNQLLHMALVGSAKDCFKLIIDALKTYDQVTKTGDTFFHFFARLRDTRLSEFDNLFANYPKLSEQKNKNGVTPLMMAAYLLNRQYIEMVTKYGQDVNLCDKKDQTALHYCIMGFLSHGDTYSTEKHEKLLECVPLLLAAGADVNAQDSKGRTALMMAAVLMDEKLIAMLLDMEADPDIVDDKHGISPLQLLSISTESDQYFRCLKLFLSYGCDFALDIPNTYNLTLIQNQFLLISARRFTEFILPNIYLLLSANCSLQGIGSDDRGYYFHNLDKSYFDYKQRDKFRKLLFLCGANANEILHLVEPTHEEEEEEKCEEKFKYFCNNITLRSRCRRVIRQIIGGNIKAKLRELAIPPGIYDFLLVKDDCRVEETAIPGQYFDYDSKIDSGSQGADSDDDEMSSYNFQFDQDCENFFSDWYDCHWYKSYTYLD